MPLAPGASITSSSSGLHCLIQTNLTALKHFAVKRELSIETLDDVAQNLRIPGKSDMQPLRRASVVFFFADGHEISEMPQFHTHILSDQSDSKGLLDVSFDHRPLRRRMRPGRST